MTRPIWFQLLGNILIGAQVFLPYLHTRCIMCLIYVFIFGVLTLLEWSTLQSSIGTDDCMVDHAGYKETIEELGDTSVVPTLRSSYNQVKIVFLYFQWIEIRVFLIINGVECVKLWFSHNIYVGFIP